MSYTIGIDHGYGAIKTANCIFKSGITAYEHEPYTLQRTLQVNGKYYVCGTARQSLKRDKTQDESYYLLTLAAIAEECKARNIPAGKLDIVLAAGLPLTRFGREKQSFRDYLLPSFQPAEFQYEGQPYRVHIHDVLLYPQGYSALVAEMDWIRKEPSLILADIGSWTLDTMRIDNGIPNAETCRSLEYGIIRCMDEIAEQVRRQTGLSVTEAQIEQVLRLDQSGMDEVAQAVILDYGKQYANKLLNVLLESGFDTQATPVVFMGGGAMLIKNLVSNIVGARFISDIHANAKGYEIIARQVITRGQATV